MRVGGQEVCEKLGMGKEIWKWERKTGSNTLMENWE